MMDEGSLQQVILIGIGNVYRSDDGIGLLVARQIREMHIPFVTVKEEAGDGASIINAWQGFNNVILIDAVSSGAKPGTIIRFDAVKEIIPANYFNYSTHAFGITEAIELARVLNTLPSSLIFYGIEGAVFTTGTTISPVVINSANTIIHVLIELYAHR